MTNQQGAPEAPRGTAADGKTELFNVPGYPLMVRAVDFNRLHAENERLAALAEAQQPAPSAAGVGNSGFEVAGEPVAWQQGSLTTVNQDPYPSLGDWFVQFWEGDDVAARVYGNDMETLRRRCAIIATPQATQAQAGAVPLTDGQIEDLLRRGNPTDEEKRLIRMGWEAAHGIKGGQHGADT